MSLDKDTFIAASETEAELPAPLWRRILSALAVMVSAIMLAFAGSAVASTPPPDNASRAGKKAGGLNPGTAAGNNQVRKSVFGRATARIVKPISVRLRNGKVRMKNGIWFKRRKSNGVRMIDLE